MATDNKLAKILKEILIVAEKDGKTNIMTDLSVFFVLYFYRFYKVV